MERFVFSFLDFSDEKIKQIQTEFARLCEQERRVCEAVFRREMTFGEASILPPLLPRQIDLTLAQRTLLGRKSDVVVAQSEPWSEAKEKLFERLERECPILLLVTKDTIDDSVGGKRCGIVVLEGDDSELLAKHLFFLTTSVVL